MSVLKIWNGSAWVQIDTIKGEPFRYEDFTPEQLADLTSGLQDYVDTAILGGSS